MGIELNNRSSLIVDVEEKQVSSPKSKAGCCTARNIFLLLLQSRPFSDDTFIFHEKSHFLEEEHFHFMLFIVNISEKL